jgi:hypothetical protein
MPMTLMRIEMQGQLRTQRCQRCIRCEWQLCVLDEGRLRMKRVGRTAWRD